MKSLLVKLLCIGVILSCNPKVWGADWKLFAETDLYECFYDAEDTAPSSNNIVDVWTKLEYTKKGITGIVKEFGKHYADLSYLLELWEINCTEKRIVFYRLPNIRQKEGFYTLIQLKAACRPGK
jgi:hypothetical protein